MKAPHQPGHDYFTGGLRFLTEIIAWVCTPWALWSHSKILAIAAVVLLICLPAIFSTPGDRPGGNSPVAVPGIVTILLLLLQLAAATAAVWVLWPGWIAGWSLPCAWWSSSPSNPGGAGWFAEKPAKPVLRPRKPMSSCQRVDPGSPRDRSPGRDSESVGLPGPPPISRVPGAMSLHLGAHQRRQPDHQRQNQPDGTGHGQVRPIPTAHASAEQLPLGVVEVQPSPPVVVPGGVGGQQF